MQKPVAKKIILQFMHNKDRLFFFQTKVIEFYDVATVLTKSVIAQNLDDAIERMKKYFSLQYEVADPDFIIRKDPKSPKGDM